METDELWALGGVGTLVLAIAWVVGRSLYAERVRRDQLRRDWQTAARQAGLVVAGDEWSHIGYAQQSARKGGLEVRFESYPRLTASGTRFTVSGLGHGANPLGIALGGSSGSLAFNAAARAVELGSKAFDEAFFIQGDPILAQALLDFDTRAKLSSLLRGSFRDRQGWSLLCSAVLVEGVLTVWVPHGQGPQAASLCELLFDALSTVLELADRLVRPEDLAVRVAASLGPEGSRREPETGVRLQCLKLLLREFPQHPATQAALSASREDPSDEIRLEVAMRLGVAGRSTLLALVEDPRTSEASAVRAVVVLGPLLPYEVAEAACRRAVERGQRELAARSLEACVRLDPARAESLLLAVIGTADLEVALVAVQALGRAGSVEAVLPLRWLEDEGPRKLAQAARQAVAEIQSRLTGAGEGQLSLTGGAAGALSLAAEAEPGRLSLADAKAGARALGPRVP